MGALVMFGLVSVIATPEQRKRAIRSIQEILEYEKQSQKVHKQEEEDKRQLSLF